MLTCGEIYYLNKALDGKKIFNVSPIMDIFTNSNENIEKTLYEKGLLNEDHMINDKACEIIRLIDIFKKSKKYIVVDDKLNISESINDFIVYFEKKPDNNFYVDRVINDGFIFRLLFDHYFLTKDKAVDNKVVKISKTDFINNYLDTCEDSVKVCKYDGFELDNEIYYCLLEDNVYKYDGKEESCKLINPKDAAVEIFSMVVNE